MYNIHLYYIQYIALCHGICFNTEGIYIMHVLAAIHPFPPFFPRLLGSPNSNWIKQQQTPFVIINISICHTQNQFQKWIIEKHISQKKKKKKRLRDLCSNGFLKIYEMLYSSTHYNECSLQRALDIYGIVERVEA